MSFTDFNDAESRSLIPKGTAVPVRMSIRPGGYNDLKRGLTCDVATRNQNGAIYLNCEFTVIAGRYSKRKIFDVIGLHSNKGPTWANMGRAFIRSLLNSSRGVGDKDNSEIAQNARRIRSLKVLDGLEFMVIVGTETGKNGAEANCVLRPINPEEKAYRGFIPAKNGLPSKWMGEHAETLHKEQQEYQEIQQVGNVLAWPR